MRFLLTLLALLSGLSVSDRAVAAPISPATMGAMVLLADTAGQAESQAARRRAPDVKADRRKASVTPRSGRSAAPVHLPGLLPGVDRAIE